MQRRSQQHGVNSAPQRPLLACKQIVIWRCDDRPPDLLHNMNTACAALRPVCCGGCTQCSVEFAKVLAALADQNLPIAANMMLVVLNMKL